MFAIFAATSPVCSANFNLSEYTAGTLEASGKHKPMVSTRHATVLAVPITAHVPELAANLPSTSFIF